MVPLIELRGAIPYGLSFGLDPLFTYALAIVGNCLPVPVILFFVKRVLLFMQRCRVRFFNRVANWVIEKAQKGFQKVQKYAALGLYLFVAIPLPGTGAWTGALIAAMFDMKKRYAFLSIFLGVLTAGVIMSLITGGILGGLSFLL
ncbi:MAG: small multi-drug export protein [Clostridia bacterium]|nr:small multi-drug export protein [Clostridia bacterium]